MEIKSTLFRAVDSRYHGPDCGWEWWTPTRAWAENYGSAIIERSASGLRLLRVHLDAEEALDDMRAEGIVLPAAWSGRGDGLDEPDQMEIQQLLSGSATGPILAAAVTAVGYDGLIHPDHLADIGEVGTAVALVR